MKDSNEILFVIQYDPHTLSELYDMLPFSKNTIRGRLHELYTKSLVRKIHGKFAITDSGLNELKKDDIKGYNFIITKNNSKSSTRIYAENQERAHSTAKLIYGSNYEVNSIGTN